MKNVGIVTILAAATATIILLRGSPNKRRSKRLKIPQALEEATISKLQFDLESRRKKILSDFEHNGHKKIPEEMNKAMDFIVKELSPNLYPPTIRLLASQLIQDYAIMFTNINNSEPDVKVIQLAKEWLDFDSNDIPMSVEQINHRYALALRSRSIKEFRLLFEWLKNMNLEKRQKNAIHQNWILRNFQCACLLGLWAEVLTFGRDLENVSPESLAASGQQQAPLHPLHLFEYIALKLPNQSANFTQVYYNVNDYLVRFDPRLTPPLKFTEWQIRSCSTKIVLGFSTNSKRNEELQEQILRAKFPTKVPSSSRFMFVYGCLVQFPCFWVQLPASNNKMQPVVLTGPWNDTEMVLTASYVRRMPKSAYVKKSKRYRKKNRKNSKEGYLQVVRSDLKLRLDRKEPFVNGCVMNEEGKQYINGEYEDEKQNGNVSSVGVKKKWSKIDSWNWRGEFEHEEGLVECTETDLNSFEFRRTFDWKKTALKFTCRTWAVHMVLATPD